MIEIQLTQGQIALVDDVDADLAELNWTVAFNSHYTNGGGFRAYRKTSKKSEKHYSQYMHRVILSRMLDRDLNSKEIVDHINHDPLDNRRSNLRLATTSENVRNGRRHMDGSSDFKGVCWDASRSKYSARILVDGKNKFLGRFDDPVQAAKAYDEAAKEHFGEFAALNFPS